MSKLSTNSLGTENELKDDESYAHITVFQPISQSVAHSLKHYSSTDVWLRILMPDLRRLREVIRPNKTDQGDGWALQSFVNVAKASYSRFCPGLGHIHDQ
jgi:hypothetical protein